MTSLILPPLKNTYISSGKPEINFAASKYLYMGTDNSGTSQRILISFDLYPLPMNIIVESALLKMYADISEDNGAAGCFTPFLATSCWEENSVTWNIQPGINTSSTGKPVHISSPGWYTWDITSIAKVWVTHRKENNGLVIKASGDKAGDVKRFYSSRSYSHKDFRPVLEIKYDFKHKFSLSSRSTVNSLESYKTRDTIYFSSWQNTSIYSMYTFFVQNIGNNPADVYVQVSPDQSAIVEEHVVYNIAPGDTKAIIPQVYGFFTRLVLKSYFFGRKTSLMIWFQAQV